MVLLGILAIVLLTVVVYFPSLKYGYISDDANVHASTKETGKPSRLKRLKQQYFGAAYYDEGVDPLARVKELKESAKGVTDPKEIEKISEEIRQTLQKPRFNRTAHAMVIINHALVSALVFVAFGGGIVSFIAAAIFVIFPLNHEGTLWLSGKPYGMTSILCLLSWCVPYLAPFVFAFSIYLTPTAIPFPLLFLLFPGYYKALVLLSGVAFYARWKQLRATPHDAKISGYAKNEEAYAIKPGKIIIWLKFYGYYLVNNLTARHLTFTHPYLNYYAVDEQSTQDAYKPDGYLFAGLAALFILIANIIYNPFWMDGPVFGLFWFTVLITPFCNFIMVGQQYITSRYSYLANAGLCLMIAHFIGIYPWLAFIPGYYCARLLNVMRQYRSDYWFDQLQIFEEPDFSFSWCNHGLTEWARGHVQAARQDFIEAARCHPGNYKAHFNLSGVYAYLQNTNGAVFALENAKKCSMIGQEKIKEETTKRREALISMIFSAQQKNQPLKLRLEDVEMMV